MSDPKLHHYVPQFHLKRFARNDGKVWVWDKKVDRAFVTSPASIAAETQFYRLPEFEALGHDPLTMEKQFSQLESEVALITTQWLDWLRQLAPLGRIEIPEQNRKLVSLYITTQFLRTADTKEVLCLLSQDPEPTSEARTRMHTELLWDMDLVNQIGSFIERAIWLFGLNRSGLPFFTSDNPVAFKTGDNRKWLKAGFLGEGTYVVFPLSPDIVMYCKEPTFWRGLAALDGCLSPVEFTREMVAHENAGQVFMAKRFVVSPVDDFTDAREFAQTIGTDRYASWNLEERREDSTEGQSS